MGFPSVEQIVNEPPKETPKKLTQIQQKHAISRIQDIRDEKTEELERVYSTRLSGAKQIQASLATYFAANRQAIFDAVEHQILSHNVTFSGYFRSSDSKPEITLDIPSLKRFLKKETDRIEAEDTKVRKLCDEAQKRVRKEARDLIDSVVFMGAPEVLSLIQEFADAPLPQVGEIAEAA